MPLVVVGYTEVRITHLEIIPVSQIGVATGDIHGLLTITGKAALSLRHVSKEDLGIGRQDIEVVIQVRLEISPAAIEI